MTILFLTLLTLIHISVYKNNNTGDIIMHGRLRAESNNCVTLPNPRSIETRQLALIRCPTVVFIHRRIAVVRHTFRNVLNFCRLLDSARIKYKATMAPKRIVL